MDNLVYKSFLKTLIVFLKVFAAFLLIFGIAGLVLVLVYYLMNIHPMLGFIPFLILLFTAIWEDQYKKAKRKAE